MTTAKNTNGLDSGSANNGRAVIRTARTSASSGLSGKIQTLDSGRMTTFSLSDFDTTNYGTNLDNRLDDISYYNRDVV